MNNSSIKIFLLLVLGSLAISSCQKNKLSSASPSAGDSTVNKDSMLHFYFNKMRGTRLWDGVSDMYPPVGNPTHKTYTDTSLTIDYNSPDQTTLVSK